MTELLAIKIGVTALAAMIVIPVCGVAGVWESLGIDEFMVSAYGWLIGLAVSSIAVAGLVLVWSL
jgi:hypothetical protein